VRGPGKARGAMAFALNFWFFWFKPKEHITERKNLDEVDVEEMIGFNLFNYTTVY
jgi:hypothetical protein